MSYAELQKLKSDVVQVSQTGQLSESLNMQFDVVTVVDPVPAPVAADNVTGRENQRNYLIHQMLVIRSTACQLIFNM